MPLVKHLTLPPRHPMLNYFLMGTAWYFVLRSLQLCYFKLSTSSKKSGTTERKQRTSIAVALSVFLDCIINLPALLILIFIFGPQYPGFCSFPRGSSSCLWKSDSYPWKSDCLWYLFPDISQANCNLLGSLLMGDTILRSKRVLLSSRPPSSSALFLFE